MIHPTEEQVQAINRRDSLVPLVAFAGAAKSSTLEMVAQYRPNENHLYVTYNKALQVEAAARYPANTKCVTSHGIAYPEYGVLFKHKLVPSIKPIQVVKALRLDGNNAIVRASRAIESVNAFLASTADSFPPGVSQETVDLWSAMADVDNTALGMTHDGYLKLYALNGPRRAKHALQNIHTLLLDEGQDANPPMLQIALGLDVQRFIVGDTHQSIYQFRGAVDAMEIVASKAPASYLTGSFRFGQDIADVANYVLSFKGIEQRIRGLGPKGMVGEVRDYKPYAFISRTNSGVFAHAVAALQKNKSIHVVGGPEGMKLDLISEVYNMSRGEKPVNTYLASYATYDELREMAELSEDAEMKGICRLIDIYKTRLPVLIDQIRRAQHKDANTASVVLATAHKSKGLGFERVVLDDNFLDFAQLLGASQEEFLAQQADLRNNPTELNLLYVALTRAKQALQLPPSLMAAMSKYPDVQSRIEQIAPRIVTRHAP